MCEPAGFNQVQPEECAPLNPPMLSTDGGVRRAGSIMLVMISGRKVTFESNVKHTFDSNVLSPDVCDRCISIKDLKMINLSFVEMVNINLKKALFA